MIIALLASLALGPTLARGVTVNAEVMVADDWRQLREAGFQFAAVSRVPDDVEGFHFIVPLKAVPPVPGPKVLPLVEAHELAEARSRFPKATLVVRPPTSDTLARVDDRNVILGFELRQPMVFTEQGRPGPLERLRNVPYPSSPRAIASLLPLAPDEHRKALAEYGNERWDAKRIALVIRRLGFEARRQRLPALCLSFGVWGERADSSHRLRYLRDVVAALREEEIGWCLRGYDDGFGFASGPPGARRFDASVISALTASDRR